MRAILTAFAASAISACDPVSLGDCPADSANQVGQGRALIAQRCLGCHNSALTGDARQQAPENLNFDRLDIVREWAGEMYSEANAGVMPPGLPMADAEVETLRVYLACGAPE
jgi:mono/diheme cytochrome c family protein